MIIHPILSADLLALLVLSHEPLCRGLGNGEFPHPTSLHEQLTTHINTLLKFGGQLKDMAGSLLHILEALQLKAGLSGNLFQFPEAFIYLTPTWLTQTWETDPNPWKYFGSNANNQHSATFLNIPWHQASPIGATPPATLPNMTFPNTPTVFCPAPVHLLNI